MNRPPVDAHRRADWLGQPRGLTILFLTEMWDQFSFYGMRSLLVYYLTKQLAFSQGRASLVYGGYAATVYLMPIFGGMVADRWLGHRKAVLTGAAVMALGHFMMAFEVLLIPALATIALGNGLFLPSLPSQIIGLYREDDPRRRSAFNIYYMGVNLGALAAPIVIGTVGEVWGWHWGFSLAGLGMLVAIATYAAGSRYLPRDDGRRRSRQATPAPTSGGVTHGFGLLIGVAAVIVVFRGAYEQLGNTVVLWADAGVSRSAGQGFTIPATWFQCLNPLVVLLLTPVLVRRWTRAAQTGAEASSGAKMATGAALVAAAFVALAFIAHRSHAAGVAVAWPWFAAFMVLLTVGELFILPVGLGLFGRLAPAGLEATTIAIWYSAGVLGNLLAGWLGTFWSIWPASSFFAFIASVALVSTLMLAALATRIRRAEDVYDRHSIGAIPEPVFQPKTAP